MLEKFFFEYLNSGLLSTSIRRLFSVIFCISISSYVYTLLYGPYQIYSLTDYLLIFRFFIDGNFFIPFIIYFLVFFLTEIPAFFIFKILEIKIGDGTTKMNVDVIYANKVKKKISINKYFTIAKISNWNKFFEKEFVNIIFPTERAEIEKEPKFKYQQQLAFALNTRVKVLSSYFTFLLRLSLISVIYFISVAGFHFLWFILVILLISIGFIIIYIFYSIINAVPDICSIIDYYAIEKEKKDNANFS